MAISVNFDALAATCLDSKGTFKHRTGDRIWLFPFVTNDKSSKNEITCELKDFRGISGEAIRICTGKELPPHFDRESLINKMLTKISTKNQDILEKIIKEVCFGNSNNVFRFSKKTLLYQRVQNPEKTLNNFAEYIAEIFLDNVEIKLDDDEPEIVLYKLLSAAIPELKTVSRKQKNNCYHGIKKIKELFFKDLAFLQQNNHLFINNFDKLLKYYLYFYLTQLVFKLKPCLASRVDASALFYSVDWEQLSESREAYIYGLKLIQEQVKEIFPHAVCLELLNYIDGVSENKFIYSELKEKLNLLSEEETQEMLQAIGNIIEFYMESLKDVKWDVFEEKYQIHYHDVPIFESINKLHKAIEFQFSDSQRSRARDGYGKWLLEFGRQNFGKRRGRLGYTHALTQDYILLFIKLCIGNASGGKIRLSELWNQLECRGIHFDLYSQQEVIIFLDKNNMLEKKSDSGDAQYVTVQG